MIPLRDMRLKRKITQQELAVRSGIPQGVISDIESGATRNPRFDTVVKLANALGMSISDFVRSDNEDNTATTKAV